VKKSKAQPEVRPDSGPFDRAHLDRMTQGDLLLAREVLRLFDSQAERQLEAMASADNAKARAEAAHTLKGAARGVGAFAVARTAEDVEACAKDDPAFASSLARLKARVAEARLALPDILHLLRD
jgi:HPt (histidine-containing phosphotransfer) domain-containing protein